MLGPIRYMKFVFYIQKKIKIVKLLVLLWSGIRRTQKRSLNSSFSIKVMESKDSPAGLLKVTLYGTTSYNPIKSKANRQVVLSCLFSIYICFIFSSFQRICFFFLTSLQSSVASSFFQQCL